MNIPIEGVGIGIFNLKDYSNVEVHILNESCIEHVFLTHCMYPPRIAIMGV
jgi:hypothetical protein